MKGKRRKGENLTNDHVLGAVGEEEEGEEVVLGILDVNHQLVYCLEVVILDRIEKTVIQIV